MNNDSEGRSQQLNQFLETLAVGERRIANRLHKPDVSPPTLSREEVRQILANTSAFNMDMNPDIRNYVDEEIQKLRKEIDELKRIILANNLKKNTY